MLRIIVILVCLSGFNLVNGQRIIQFGDESKDKEFSGTIMGTFDINRYKDIETLKNDMYLFIENDLDGQFIYVLGYEPMYKTDKPFTRDVYLYKRHFDTPDNWGKASDIIVTHHYNNCNDFTSFSPHYSGDFPHMDELNINGEIAYVMFFHEYGDKNHDQKTTRLIVLKPKDKSYDQSTNYDVRVYDLNLPFIPEEISKNNTYISAGKYNGVKYKITFDNNLIFTLHMGDKKIIYD